MTVLAERPVTAPATAAGSLAIRPDQTAWTEQQQAVLRQSGISDEVTAAELASFLHLCQRTQLDPFSRQIYLIGRYDKRKQRTVFTPQTGIDGYRVIAQRVTGQTGGTYGYEDTLWCDSAGRWRDVWLSDDPPAAAKVTVIRNGARFSAVARFSEYAETWPDGNLKAMWAKMPAGQIAKCCEALALRKAFPHDLAGVYTSEEMAQADNAEAAPQLQRQAPGQDAWDTATPARTTATPETMREGVDNAEPRPDARLTPPAEQQSQQGDNLSPQARGFLRDAETAQTPAQFATVRQAAEDAGAPAPFLAWLDRIAAEKFAPAEDGADPATGDGNEHPVYTGPAAEPVAATLPGAPASPQDRLGALAVLYQVGETAGLSADETRALLAQHTGKALVDATGEDIAAFTATLRAAGGAR